MTEQPDPREFEDDGALQPEPWTIAFVTQAEKIARVEAEARRLGETDVRAIRRAIEAEGPVGRLILKLLGLPATPARRGRPLQDLGEGDDFMVAEVVSDLRRAGKSAVEAYREAPAILAAKGICEPGSKSKPLSQAAVKAAWRRRVDRVRHWFQEPAEGQR